MLHAGAVPPRRPRGARTPPGRSTPSWHAHRRGGGRPRRGLACRCVRDGRTATRRGGRRSWPGPPRASSARGARAWDRARGAAQLRSRRAANRGRARARAAKAPAVRARRGRRSGFANPTHRLRRRGSSRRAAVARAAAGSRWCEPSVLRRNTVAPRARGTARLRCASAGPPRPSAEREREDDHPGERCDVTATHASPRAFRRGPRRSRSTRRGRRAASSRASRRCPAAPRPTIGRLRS